MTATCPECDATITLAADVVEGEIIICVTLSLLLKLWPTDKQGVRL